MNTIEVWQPRYKDDTVLVATHKVQSGMNRIIFTKAKHLEGKEYFMESKDLKSYPTQPNGRGKVYIVPMEDFNES